MFDWEVDVPDGVVGRGDQGERRLRPPLVIDRRDRLPRVLLEAGLVLVGGRRARAGVQRGALRRGLD